MVVGGGMLIVWLLVVGAVVAAVAGLNGLSYDAQDETAPRRRRRDRSPEEILQARYDSSGTNRDEYADMHETLYT